MRLAAACAVGAGILLLAGLGAERAPLAPAIAPAAASSGDLAPSERHRRVMRLVSEVVERQHYRQTPLDDAMSSQIYERYLEALDGARSYLLASDIAEFEPLRYQLDDAIERADVGPAFGIFTRFQERNREVLRYALGLLDTEPDFSIDESFRFDRSDEGWPASVDALPDVVATSMRPATKRCHEACRRRGCRASWTLADKSMRVWTRRGHASLDRKTI
jgi:carboxyl-terminal processing protease